MLAVPLGLLGYLWLERANLARMGYSINIEAQGAALHRSCIESTLTTRMGRRYVRSFEEALMVEIPTLQYHQRPERVRVIMRLTSDHHMVVESAYYKAREIARNYNDVMPGAISELVDAAMVGCAEGRQGWSWTAQCTRGPGYTGECLVPRQGTQMPAGARLQTFRD